MGYKLYVGTLPFTVRDAELKQAAALAAKAAVKARDGDSEWVDAYLELQQTAVSMVKGETQ